MQDIIENQKLKLEQLNQRLADIEAERESIQDQVKALESSLIKPNPASLWNHATVTAVIVLAVATLLLSGVFHNAQSNVKKNDQPGVARISALETVQIVRAEHPSTRERVPAPGSDKKIKIGRASCRERV